MSHSTAALVTEYKSSGLTQKEFCNRKAIAVSALQYHLAKARKEVERREQRPVPASRGSFIPLRLGGGSGGPTTVVMVRGHVGCSELAELIRAMAE